MRKWLQQAPFVSDFCTLNYQGSRDHPPQGNLGDQIEKVMFLLIFISFGDTPCFLPWTDVSLSKAALAAEMISKSLPSAGLGDKEAGYSSALQMG